ncbi:uncharacterized protein [Gossypium hirsutum]|uniref:Uncharacterized protein isoform X1 n=3 Tax=Gossypium TaxID=3633 RepID=A0ABM2YKT6_GOSHI|nr:uncharacterized protein LOC107928251 isoform X1 [Gossypium hirsutum]
MSVKGWLNEKIVDPMIQILRKGAQPKQLAFSAALGLTIGVFPICGNLFYFIYLKKLRKKMKNGGMGIAGVTVVMCGMAIAVLGSLAHSPTVMLANFIATPIELSLMVPFLRFGELLTGGEPFELTSDALNKVLTGQASTELLFSIARALLGWLVAAPIVLGTLYFIFLPMFKFLVPKFSGAPEKKEHDS